VPADNKFVQSKHLLSQSAMFRRRGSVSIHRRSRITNITRTEAS